MTSRPNLASRVSPILVCGCLALAACGGSSTGNSTTGTTKSTYVIGLTGAFTGSNANVGVPIRDGAKAYFDQLNAKGGVDGHPVKLVAIDDKATPALGAANVKDILSQGGLAMLGLHNSNVVAAVQADLAKNQLPGLVLSLGTTDVLTPNPTPGLYSPFLPAWANAGVEVDYAAQALKLTNPKVGIVSFTSTAGRDLADRLQATVKARGWSVAANEGVVGTETDLSPVATKLAGADVVLSGLDDPRLTLLMHAFRPRSAQTPVINYNSGSSFNLLNSLADPNLYVVRDIAYTSDPAPGVKSMLSALTAIGADPNTGFIDRGYLQAVVLTAALRKCGDGCTGAKLTAALDNLGSVDTQGLTPAALNFSAKLHVGTQQVKVFGWQPGGTLKASNAIKVNYA